MSRKREKGQVKIRRRSMKEKRDYSFLVHYLQIVLQLAGKLLFCSVVHVYLQLLDIVVKALTVTSSG